MSPSTQARLSEIRRSYPTFDDFCRKFSVTNLSAGARHPAQCVTCSSPTLIDVNLTYGEGRAIAWLVVHLTYFQEQVNIPGKMTPLQIETCAQAIHDAYGHLKATELMLFFARLCGGLYNVDWHGYVTPDKILSALRDHFTPWRNNLLDKIEQQQREQKEREDRQLSMSREEYEKQKTQKSPSNPQNPLTP